MARTTVRIVSNLGPKLSAQARVKASAVVRATALGIEGDAKARAPVDTGALRASITTEMDGELRAGVGTNIEYGAAVEYGSAARNTPAQPFLTPAVEAARPRFAAAMKSILD